MKCAKSFILSAMLLFTFSVVKAQVAREADINPDGSIALPTEQELSSMYTVDISSLEFGNLEEAVAYFSEFNSNYVVFRPNVDENKAYLFVQKTQKPNWAIEDWNAHLSELVIFNDQ